METTELFYPEIIASIGGYTFKKGIEIEVYSNKASYFDWGKVRFTRQFKERISITAKSRAVIRLGYNGVFEQVFEGFVTKGYDSASGMNEIAFKDDMALLEETKISNTFLDATPHDVLGYCLSQAGVSKAKLSSGQYPAKKRFAVYEKNVISVIHEIHSAWDISERFFFSGGAFHWGEKPEQTKIYTFEYAENIIKLNRAGGLWELETVSAPFIRHSHVINIAHPQVSGSFEVVKVIFTTNDAGFIRTFIYF